MAKIKKMNDFMLRLYVLELGVWNIDKFFSQASRTKSGGSVTLLSHALIIVKILMTQD